MSIKMLDEVNCEMGLREKFTNPKTWNTRNYRDI